MDECTRATILGGIGWVYTRVALLLCCGVNECGPVVIIGMTVFRMAESWKKVQYIASKPPCW